LCLWTIVLRLFAGRDAHNLDGVADHVSGALFLKVRGAWSNSFNNTLGQPTLLDPL
jgi:hypothetical protein